MPLRAPLAAPPPLAPGARVGLVAPAGPLRGEEDVARAEANARALGWEPVVAGGVLGRTGYLAGPDETRARDFDAVLADPRIDGIWCLRGGYGTMRIIDRLDFAALARSPKPIVGFSDITAIHCAAAVHGVATFHGPVARSLCGEFSRSSLARALGSRCDPCGAAPGARTLRGGWAEGILAGGNLALLAALAGTPWAPRLDDAILVVEDVGEAVYRIDRMLRQLRLAGLLAGVRGIVFGAFTERPDEPDGLPLDDVLAETADALGVPCIAGAPIGHIDDQWTIPLGARAVLDADARSLSVSR